MKHDLHQEITDRILSDMVKHATLPWEKPWKNANTLPHNFTLPFNVVSKRPYRGINILLLWGNNYPTHQYLTYKQALSLSGNVRKGEKGHQVVFYKPMIVKERLVNNTIRDKKILLMRTYTIFNIAQCDNLNLPQPKPQETPIFPVDTTELMQALNANLTHGGNSAHYTPALDQITMPMPAQFKSPDHYRATLYHETIHWTGHESRLDRSIRNAFGSSEYAFEELIAELGGAFMCAEYNLPYQTQHATYLNSWIKHLEGDKKAIFKAASQAQKALDHIRTTLTGGPLPVTDETYSEGETVIAN